MRTTQRNFLSPVLLHKYQWQVYNSTARFRIVVAGRRFGKTHLALAEMLRAARAPGRIIWYVGPTKDQSHATVWDRLTELTRPYWAGLPNLKYHRIDLIWGSSIFVNGAFEPGNLRGPGIDFLVIDEYSRIDPYVWTDVLRASLADRQGRALIIGTPEGLNHFYDLFEFAKKQTDEWEVFQFTTEQGGLVARKELESAAGLLTREAYNREFCADFSTTIQHRAYHTFDRTLHVKPVDFDPTLPLIWSLDFNVNPMAMLLMQRVADGTVHVLEEIILHDAHTEAACQAFLRRANHYHARVSHIHLPLKVDIYGDASGNQRRTTGVHTDWFIIRNFFTTWVGTFEPRFYTAKANPLVRDRINCVNAVLRNHRDETRIIINAGCGELIKDLDQVAWATDKTGAVLTELDKSDKARTHASDALGYYLSEVFPLKPKGGHQSGPLPVY